MTTLAGKTLFITGGSRGIGREIALRAARDGANVAIAAKTAEPHPKLAGTIHTVAEEIGGAAARRSRSSSTCATTNADREAIERAAKDVRRHRHPREQRERHQPHAHAADARQALRPDVGVNVRATFLCSQAASAPAKKSPTPTSSRSRRRSTWSPKWFAGHVAYTMSKYGMSMCTLGMAEELRGDGIAVNSLWPRTTIATAAVEVHFPEAILRRAATRRSWPTPRTRSSRATRAPTREFLHRRGRAAEGGETDFARYAVTPGVRCSGTCSSTSASS
jgi:citronellol/citronellal dehydrogenase